jgi:hypothetical protein
VKVAIAASTLARFADALEVSGSSAAAPRLRAFARALDPVATSTVDKFASLCSTLKFPKGSPDSIRLSELVPITEALLQLLRGIVEPKLLSDLEQLLAVVVERGNVSIDGLASVLRDQVVSASKGQPKKGATPVNQSLVDDYLKRLDAALGDDPAFMALFRELEADKRITKSEAVELATRFLGPTPLSTSRPKALQRVLHRHQKLVDFKRSSQSIGGGRSAA